MAKKGAEIIWLGAELLEKIGAATDEALYEGADLILRAAVARAPKRKGRLAASGYVASATRSNYAKSSRTARRQIVVKPGQAVIAFAEFYARFMEAGTKGHIVKPRRRRALQTGANRWAARVNVRGIRGGNFLYQAGETERDAALQRIVTVVQGEID